MKYIFLFSSCCFLVMCLSKKEYDIPKYFELINQAELHICDNEFNAALNFYENAFKQIDKPFGKDVFNAALVGVKLNKKEVLEKNIQKIINNSNDLNFVKSFFVDKYITNNEWDNLLNQKQIEYNEGFRKKIKEVLSRDQLFRPIYEVYDDTINANRKINLRIIDEITDSIDGFPSHQELGYTERLRTQNHYIVLHHTGQRRSYDKSVVDMEKVLYSAVHTGRFDPEYAIQYMRYQNDLEKGVFEVYATEQYKHSLLPDSLNNKIWLPYLSDERKKSANSMRQKWLANSIDDIVKKTKFLSTNDDGFIFTSVNKSTRYLKEDFDKQTAIDQYNMGTAVKVEYKE